MPQHSPGTAPRSAPATPRTGRAGVLALLVLLPSVVHLVAHEADALGTDMVAFLPNARAYTSAIWDGQNAYVLAGSSGDTVRYSPSTNTVTSLGGNLGRLGTSVAWDGQHAYLFGGVVGFSTHTNQIVRYTPATNTFATMSATLPTARSYTSAIWDGQNAYVFGGYDGTKTLKEIVRYDPATNVVTTLGLTLPSGHSSGSAVWDGQHAYLLGGLGGNSQIVRFDPAAGTAAVVATLPGPRSQTSAVWDGQHAYLFGGGQSPYLDTVVRFTPATNQVTTLGFTLPSPRSYTSAIWDGQNAYIFGGNTGLSSRTNEIVRFTRPVGSAPLAPTPAPGPGAGQISFAWQPPDPATFPGTILGYHVYRGDAAGAEALLTSGGCSGVTTLNCTDSGLPSNVTRYYRVSAFTSAGEGDISASVGARTFEPPGPPQSLAASSEAPQAGIRLTWNPPARNPPRDGGFPIMAYSIYRGEDSGEEHFLARVDNVTSYVDIPCEAASRYFYKVTATTIAGEGPMSGEVEATGINPGVTRLSPTPCVDGYSLSAYRPESATGNTPFSGLALKPTFPGSQARPSVNLANGETVASFTLLRVDEPLGDDLSFDLTYRSTGNAGGASALSWRWSAGWLQRLEAAGLDYRLHTGDGRVLTFTKTISEWDGPPGSYAKITSAAGKLELQDRHGSRRVFDPAKSLALTDVYDAAGNHWTLAYHSLNGRLETITDPLGRVLTLTYDPTVSVAGNPFYAANGKPILTGITDFAGRSTALEYDVLTGRLVAIKTPGPTAGSWATTRFTYDLDNRVTAVQDPQGQSYVTIRYDALGRTLAQRTPVGADHYFQYNHSSGITRVWDGNGNEVEWRFLPAGAVSPRVVPSAKIEHTRGLRQGDPLSYTTTFTHNLQDELRTVTYPAGNSVTNTYDEASPSFFARGNLLTETRSPGTVLASPLQSTSQSAIVTRYTYDPVCNKPATIVDPPGNDAGFTPPNGGAASAPRYMTTITYNSACKPLSIQRPTVNPTGVPDPAFTSAYASQAIAETWTYNSAGQALTHTDPSGVVTTFSYYAAPSSPGKPAGHLQSVAVDPGSAPHLALTTTHEYNDFGVVNKTADPRGNVRTFAIDLRGRITQETGPVLPGGSIRTLRTYDANDDLLVLQRETSPGSGTYTSKENAYDTLGRLVSETVHPSATSAIVTQRQYDGTGNIVRRIGGAGETREWMYDERGLLLSASGPDGGTYAYDANGNLRTATDPLGRVTSHQYDGYDRLAVETDPQQSRFVKSYDPAGNVVAERGLGGTGGRVLYERSYAHDEANRVYERREWLQSAETMPPATATSLGSGGRWVRSLHEHDARGYETRRVDDNGHVTAMAYDAAGRPSATTDPAGNVEERAYDKNGNLVQVKRTVAGATLTTCPQFCTTQHAYDAQDRRTTTTNPDGTTRTQTYDGRGNLVQTTDEAGHVVLHTFDLADRPTMTRRSLGTTPATYVTTTTQWDGEGRVASRCDDANQCTTYTYVPATSLVATQVPPTGPSVTISYDAAANARTVSASSGKTIHLEYDALDRLVSVELADAPVGAGTVRQRFAYDDMGRLTQAVDDGVGNLGGAVMTSLGQVIATQRFDTLGRVIGESQLGLGVSHVLDGVGNVLSTAYPSVDGRVVSRSYDAADRLDRVWDAKGLVADYAYQGGRVSQKAFGGPTPTPPATGAASPAAGTVVAYDGAERPATIQHKDGAGTVLAGLTTRFDAAGNRAAQKLQGAAAGAGTDKHSQLYLLDALSRTTSWKRGVITGSSPSSPLDTVASPLQQASWPGIDGQNDWLTWDPGTGPCSRTTGTTGSPPVRQVSDACTSGTKAYTYDADGNLASDGTYAYRWDFLNRLIRVNDAAGNLVVGYGYDAFGRRVVKVFSDSSPAAPGVEAPREGWYTFAGQHVVQESQPVGSVLPTAVPPTPPDVHVLRQWVYGPGVDEVLAMDADDSLDGGSAIGPGDSRYFYAYDSGANVLGLLSQAGRLVEGYSYQPYGAVSVLVPGRGATDVKWDGTDAISTGTHGSDPTPRPYSPSGNLWFFTGRQYDPEVGLYNYRARHYHPGLGQFMSLDPIGGWGDPKSLGNPYAYVGNNPGSWRDPSGLYGWADFLDDAGDFGTAVTAFVPCGCTDWAREDVRRTYADFRENSAAPAPLKLAAEAFGPPQSKTEAVFVLGLAVVAGPGGKAASASGRASAALADDAAKVAARSADEAAVGARGVDFLVGPKGDVIPVPKGAQGPLPTVNPQGKGTGFHFEGGSGGHGLHPRVKTVRVMDATPGAPDGYVVYMNKARQGVNPWTGRTIANDDPWRHILLGGK